MELVEETQIPKTSMMAILENMGYKYVPEIRQYVRYG